MAINEVMWSGSYEEARFPPWPCPACGRHSLHLKDGSLARGETKDSRESYGSEDWEPDWVTERFVCLLVCQNRHCGEVCSVTGDTSYVLQYDGEREMRFEPHFIEPAPDIVLIPKGCPELTAKELRAAFSLFWSDPSAALNRTRTSVEALLDAGKIQRKARSKKGDLHPLSLHQRIEKFLPKDAQTRSKMLAVKWLGNLGSHDRVTRGQVLEAFELVEYILEVVVEKRPQRLDRLAKDINKRKGRQKKPARFPLLIGTSVGRKV